VNDAGPHGRSLAGSERALTIAEEKADLAAEHEESLVDRRMDVRRSHATAGADEEMRHEHLLGMLPRVREDDDAFAGDGILEHGARRGVHPRSIQPRPVAQSNSARSTLRLGAGKAKAPRPLRPQ